MFWAGLKYILPNIKVNIMGYIYLVTNDINDKVYVGQTTSTIEHRWGQHLSNSRSGREGHFYNAIRKYGEEHFKIKVLEKCATEDLDQREIYWIDYYKSYDYGYNSTTGGKGNISVDYQFIYELYEDDYTLNEIVKYTGYSMATVQRYVRNYKDYNERKNKNKYLGSSKIVSQYTKDGDYIKTYPSISEAARQLECTTGPIIDVIQGKSGNCKGYQFRYGGDRNNIGVAPPPKHNKQMVVQLNDDGHCLKIFKSITDAVAEVGGCNSNIRYACKHGTRSKGFKWMKFEDWLEQFGISKEYIIT